MWKIEYVYVHLYVDMDKVEVIMTGRIQEDLP